MSRGDLKSSLAPCVFALAWVLVLTACSSVQQMEAPPPAPGSSRPDPGAVSPGPSQGNASTSAVPTGGSVLDGVFTAQQASRGESRFGQVCEACHSISEFRGGRFRFAWVGRTVGDLFESMSTLMPDDDPGSLSFEEYSAIIGYMLRENGYPEGTVELAADGSALQGIQIVAAAP
jgi:hypothetical protein